MASQQALVKTALVVGIIALLVVSIDAGVATVQEINPGTVLGGGSSLAASLGLGSGNRNTLSTEGDGSVTLSPSEAKITLGEVTQASTAQEASNANAKVIDSVLAQLNDLGIANSSITTLSYSVTPQYDYKSSPPAITGFETSQSLQVTVEAQDINQLGAKVGQVVDAAVGAGANQVSQVSFTVSDQTIKQANSQALQLAIQDASSKAQLMATALGVKITGVDTVSSSTTTPIQYLATPSAAAVGATTIPPGNFTVSASVQVTYYIQ